MYLIILKFRICETPLFFTACSESKSLPSGEGFREGVTWIDEGGQSPSNVRWCTFQQVIAYLRKLNNYIDRCNFFFQHYLRALSAKNANHLQTTDTIKRHQRYSIHYHCGWPSLGIWGSATHYGLTALPEPFLRACGLHKAQKNQSSRVILACLWFAQGLHKAQKNQNSRAVLWCSGWFDEFNFIDWRNLFFQHYLTKEKT